MPLRVNQIPRQIPEQSFYLKLVPSMFIGGMLPFAAIFIELFFILSSFWSHKMYYVFGFLFLVFFVLVITCIQVSILLCYFHLCSEVSLHSFRITTGGGVHFSLLVLLLFLFAFFHFFIGTIIWDY
jgi:transmembrane 9 superfamily protein 2/4